MKKLQWWRLAAMVLVLAAVAFSLWRGNVRIGVSHYDVPVPQHPELEGFTVAQVADLHNTSFGPGNEDLIEKLAASHPDIIAVTGDLIGMEHDDFTTAMDLLGKLKEIAPIYFVAGNHEVRNRHYEKFRQALSELGVQVMNNEETWIPYGGSKIRLIGITDPTVPGDQWGRTEASVMAAVLEELEFEDPSFRLLLSHRPEYFELYAAHGLDLVLSGHAHGGQIRLPFIGALAAPGQGWFPAYTEGLHEEGGTYLAVSRGLGNSLIPLRVNNPPELVIVRLTGP